MRCAWYRACRCFKVLSMAESEPGDEVARSELRASHDDRDRVVEMLRVSAGDGRLTADELDERMEVKVTSGHVLLDFTRAVITHPSLRLDIDVRSGAVKLMTRPGIVVDTDDVTIRSGGVKVREPWGTDTPVQLRIMDTGRVGSGHFVARPRYRNFWQWLTRQPKPYMITAR